jgi:hypothetical protein
VFDFIKKGGEIRLEETLATIQPSIGKNSADRWKETVPKPNPGKPGDDKI